MGRSMITMKRIMRMFLLGLLAISVSQVAFSDAACQDHYHWCLGLIQKNRAYCYKTRSGHAQSGCCASCNRYKTRIPGCDYGNKVSWCSGYSRSDCGITAVHTTRKTTQYTTRRPTTTTQRPDDEC